MSNQMTPEGVESALKSILNYWITHTVDPVRGGFYGRIGEDGVPDPASPKGSVLNARILWTFSAACRRFPDPRYLEMATRAFDYYGRHFVDPLHGGVFWSVDAEGSPLDAKKQVYAIAFGVYGLSEYYAATRNAAALDLALRLFGDIEEHSFDKGEGGYFEAFARDWGPLPDLRLSAKDANEKKTMNTHLHVLEAYVNLYRVWPDGRLARQIGRLLGNFADHLIDPVSGHLLLFFDEHWNPRSGTVSFGHDIEASWLLLEGAAVIGHEVPAWKALSLKLASAAAEGIAPDGGLYYEREPGDRWSLDKHWWVQAEALVGYYNAWQLTGDETWLRRAGDTWRFVNNHILDRRHGEWYWGVREDNSPMPGEDKVGIWKCPYHNSRSILELLHRMAGKSPDA